MSQGSNSGESILIEVDGNQIQVSRSEITAEWYKGRALVRNRKATQIWDESEYTAVAGANKKKCRSVGACCFANGTCKTLSKSECNRQGGTYKGDGTRCWRRDSDGKLICPS